MSVFGVILARIFPHSVSLSILSDCGKMWIRITPNTGLFTQCFFFVQKTKPYTNVGNGFFVNFDTIVIYKKGLFKLYHEIAVDTMAFLGILFVKLSKFLSGISDLFLLPHTGSFYRLTGTSRVKSFSNCQTIFSDHKNLSLMELAQVSLIFWVPSLIFDVFKPLNCLSFIFTILRIDD